MQDNRWWADTLPGYSTGYVRTLMSGKYLHTKNITSITQLSHFTFSFHSFYCHFLAHNFLLT